MENWWEPLWISITTPRIITIGRTLWNKYDWLTDIDVWIQLCSFVPQVIYTPHEQIAAIGHIDGFLGQLLEQIFSMMTQGTQFTDDIGQRVVSHTFQFISGVDINWITTNQHWLNDALGMRHGDGMSELFGPQGPCVFSMLTCWPLDLIVVVEDQYKLSYWKEKKRDRTLRKEIYFKNKW